jgi:hypothetical protein
MNLASLSALRTGRLCLQEIPVALIFWRRIRLQGHRGTRRIKSIKNPNDSIGNRTRELPAYSSVPQRTALPGDTLIVKTFHIFTRWSIPVSPLVVYIAQLVTLKFIDYCVFTVSNKIQAYWMCSLSKFYKNIDIHSLRLNHRKRRNMTES